MQTQTIINAVTLIFELFSTKILGKFCLALMNPSKLFLTKFVLKH